MKLSICKNIKLDGDYTNHSIRSTVISTLDNAGFESRHIIQLSSHKSESTIKEYSTKCPENKRKEMFQSLSEAMTPTNKRRKLPTAATASKPEEIKEVAQNLPTFQIEPIDDFNTIDDHVLADLMLDFPLEPVQTPQAEQENRNPNINAPTNDELAVTKDPRQPQKLQEINTQFNTFNQNRIPAMPQMYFPNSHVTINYNFKN